MYIVKGNPHCCYQLRYKKWEQDRLYWDKDFDMRFKTFYFMFLSNI